VGPASTERLRSSATEVVGARPATPVSSAPPRSRAPLLAVAVAGVLVVTAGVVLALRSDAGGGGGAGAGGKAGEAGTPAEVAGASTPAEAGDAPVVPAGPCPEGMVLVEGGSYFMGVDSPDPVLATAAPSHKVEVASFCLDRQEVTVAEFHRCSDPGECKRAFLKSHWAEEEPVVEATAFSSLCNEGREGVDDHPINCVTWAQAAAFCKFRNARLPTEAEWERAARGGDGRMFPWGEPSPGPQRLNACGSECLAWFRFSKIGLDAGLFNASDAHVETSPVGSFPQGRAKGDIDDLAGNVAEWTSDVFTAYPGGTLPALVPEGARVVRGASIHSTSTAEVDPAYRRPVPETWHPHDVGFRCAADPSGTLAEQP
jgi:formylglycine-generating enzyme required for sulfatase activity